MFISLNAELVGLNLRIFGQPSSPFLYKKGTVGSSKILLSKRKHISDQEHACEVFNNYFVNVAKDIGSQNDASHDLSTYPNVIKITENMSKDSPLFSFKYITKRMSKRLFLSFILKQSIGLDGISTELLRFCLNTISGLINTTITPKEVNSY